MKWNGQPARIAKVIARSGLCSRREAERWIKAGRVAINGRICKDPATNIDTVVGVKVDGLALPVKEPVRVWRYHKPVGLLTTERDPEKRKTIFGSLPSSLPRVISVGRLDLNSEGLLLLTNDGELSRQFELPSMGWERHYRVRVFGRPQRDSLRALANGMSVAGVRYAPIDVKLEKQSGANGWLRMTLREGKNREIRKVCESFGWRVNRLIRIGYGPFELGNLKRGEVDEVHFGKLAEYVGPKIISRMQKVENRASPNDKKGRRI
ncbi:MAG: pseudouridine synthase [Pseudomonadota bacterium]|nr:pseudouridine synthase [Pseudomonadota bacterium]